MSAANFTRSMPHVLAYEGKFSNHPSDPGGRTYEGITQRVWDAYCSLKGLPRRELSKSTGTWKDWPKHRDAIYREQYWDAVSGDDLPAGVDFAVFDVAVNSGTDRAIRLLQKALRLNQVDGVIGKVTKAAIENHPDHDRLVGGVCDERLAFLKRLKTWPTFGVGWGKRVAAVRKTGQAWATGSVGPKPVDIPEPMAKAEDKDAVKPPSTAPADAAIGAGGGSATIGTSIEAARDALSPYAGTSENISKVVAALIIIGLLVAVGGFVWRWHVNRKAAKIQEALE